MNDTKSDLGGVACGILQDYIDNIVQFIFVLGEW